MSALSDLFTYLVNKGYNVIYKRPTNKEFTPDLNEQISLAHNHTLHADLEGVGPVSDYEFCKYFNGKVIDINEIETEDSYNELELLLLCSEMNFCV